MENTEKLRLEQIRAFLQAGAVPDTTPRDLRMRDTHGLAIKNIGNRSARSAAAVHRSDHGAEAGRR